MPVEALVSADYSVRVGSEMNMGKLIGIIIGLLLVIPIYFLIQNAEAVLGETKFNIFKGIGFVVIGIGCILVAFSKKFRKENKFNKILFAGGVLTLFGGSSMLIVLSIP
jgi:hypothetical protein